MASPLPDPPSLAGDKNDFTLNLQHGHKDLVQAVAFNGYGDRCATGSVDGKIRVFNRHKDGTWRLCDTWGAHGGEILELQWLPPTVYPNLVASLGIEGRFKLWAEDPSAAPGRRFSASASSRVSSSSAASGGGRAAFETRSSKAPYRSFSLKHHDETRHTYLALLAADGRLTVYENDQPENLAEYVVLDQLDVCARPARGEESAFTVRFDPNPDPCYAALRAGLAPDALGLVVAAMGAVKVYRTREAPAAAAFGSAAGTKRQFYLAAELGGHRGLVRDVAWAPGNIRGYDVVATACQDGFVRVFRIDTPWSADDGRSWSVAELAHNHAPQHPTSTTTGATTGSHGSRNAGTTTATATAAQSSLTASLAGGNKADGGAGASVAASANGGDGRQHVAGQHLPGEIRHAAREISRLDSHRTPVWRVDFNDDGQILGSVGDDGKLMCYRQVPDGSWAKSSELGMLKARMMAP